MDNRTPEQRQRDDTAAQIQTYGSFGRPERDESGYWGGVAPGARDIAPGVVEDPRLPADVALYGSPEENLAAVNGTISEDDIEVKYTPNRAERRAQMKHARRMARRGQRAYDRQIKALEAEMSPEEIERARRLADKARRG